MYADDPSTHLCDPARLAVLRTETLLDTPSEEAFDRLSRLAARRVNAPVALVLLVVADRQFFKRCIGPLEPWRSLRETPRSHFFCRRNRVAGHPLRIEDAGTHPLVYDNLAIRELNVISYLGIPLVTSGGHLLGLFCVTDSKPSWWGGGRHRHPGRGCSGDDRDPGYERRSQPGSGSKRYAATLLSLIRSCAKRSLRGSRPRNSSINWRRCCTGLKKWRPLAGCPEARPMT